MMAKSRPLLAVGDFNRRSTFSRSAYFGFLRLSMRSMDHQSTPFLPSMPFASGAGLLTE